MNSEPEYCLFHTHPEKIKDGVESRAFVTTIQQSDVESDAVARRKKQFIGATFGYLEIDAALKEQDEHRLGADDDYPIVFDHAVFKGGLSAQDVVFQQPIRACYTQFDCIDRSESHIPDLGVRNKYAVDFNGAEFAGRYHKAYVGGATYEAVNFRHAEFTNDGTVRFGGAAVTADGQVRFDGVTFRTDGGVSFAATCFQNGEYIVTFRGSSFTGDTVSFSNSEFHGSGTTEFTGTTFNTHVRFTDAEFNTTGGVSFTSCRFRGNAGTTLRGACFYNDGSVSFDNISFVADNKTWSIFGIAVCEEIPEKNIDFREIEIDSECEISFAGANFIAPRSGWGWTKRTTVTSADFAGVDLSGADCSDANLTGVNLRKTDVSSADLRDATVLPAVCDGANFAKSVMNTGTRVGIEHQRALFGRGVRQWGRDAEDHDRTARGVHALREAAAENGLRGKARRLRLRERKERRREAGRSCVERPFGMATLRNWTSWLGSWLASFGTGYGISVTRPAFLMIGLIAVFALVYRTVLPTALETFGEAVAFSAKTFILAGLDSAFSAMPPLVQVIYLIEYLCGKIFTVLIGYILATRDNP
ncbi:pentapeptide repeat-containing protein [Halogeometricum borinquense]|nr:pentapeptide repeat-containing protein [Halogeometricum borinquense]